MRKLILLIAVCFTSLSYTQEIKLVGNKFTTQIMDGSNELKTISFTISQETIEKIKQSESYLKTAADTEFLKRNFEKRGDIPLFPNHNQPNSFLFLNLHYLTFTAVRIINCSKLFLSPKSCFYS